MSFWSKLGKIALKVGGGAAMFIPGMQPLGALAIGAGTGAASAALDHKGLGGILTGAAMGAAPAGASMAMKGAGILQGTGLASRLGRSAISSAVGGRPSASSGGGGGARVTDYDPGTASDPDNPWDDEGNYIGPSTVSTSDGSSSGGKPSWLDPAIDIGTGAAGMILQNHQAENQRKAYMASAEMNRNPYQNLLDQGSTMGRLDMMANGTFTAPPTKLAGPYAQRLGMDQIDPGPSWTPTDATRGVARQAMTQVAGGRGQNPTMTNPDNYGKTTSVSYAPPTPVGASATPAATLGASNLNPLIKRLLLQKQRALPPAPAPAQSWLS